MAVFDMKSDHELTELRAQFRRLEEKYLTSNRQLEERIEECARLRADAEELWAEFEALNSGMDAHSEATPISFFVGLRERADAALANWQSKHRVKR